LKIDPNLNLVHYNLGVALIRMDRTDAGLRELRTYLGKAAEPDIAENARMIIQNPKIPTPVLEMVSSIKLDYPDGYRYNHTLKIKNWDSFPLELFKPSKFLPPCTMGASAASMGTRLEITVMGDQPPNFPPMCNIRDPAGLQHLSVFSQLTYRGAAPRVLKPKSLYVRIKDRLTGNMIYSEPIAIP
jgi:hypothetical protein